MALSLVLKISNGEKLLDVFHYCTFRLVQVCNARSDSFVNFIGIAEIFQAKFV